MVTSSFGPEGAAQGAEDVETWLGVEGIELTAPHGVYDVEIARGNLFRIDVHIKGPFASAVDSDELRDTFDYDRIVQRVHGVSRRRRFRLIESFAGAIARDLLLERRDLSEVRVRVKKLSFPDWGPEACATAVVTVRLKPEA